MENSRRHDLITRVIPVDGKNACHDLQTIHAVMAYPEDAGVGSEGFWAPVWMDRAPIIPVGRKNCIGVAK